jgi:hypothetical protein
MSSRGRDRRFISSPKCADRFWSLLVLLFGGYGNFFLGDKEAGAWRHLHSSSSAEVKNEGYYTSSPPYAFVECTETALLYALYPVMRHSTREIQMKTLNIKYFLSRNLLNTKGTQ